MHIPELDGPITEQEVRQAIKMFKHGKAAGLHNMCGEFLKGSEHLVAPYVTTLFKTSMSAFPSEWCKSVIIPL